MQGMTTSDTTTLYLRGVPRPIAREAKAAAAREGITLARWVSKRLAGAKQSVAASDDEPSVSFDDDLAFFRANAPRFERKYPGEYLAIVNREVVDHDGDFEALARRVFAKFGTRSICMPRVGRSEIRVRSPRRVDR